MAPAVAVVKAVIQLVSLSVVSAAGYGITRPATREYVKAFFTGPGKWTRITLLLLALQNWKSMPMAWTIRIWRAMIYHLFIRPRPCMHPRVLFHPAITTSYTSLLEIDYNIHKSNSTYFSDLDVSRAHLVSNLLRPGLKAVADNEITKVVVDPQTGKPVKGRLGVILGSVHASFKREIPPLQKFQIWSRVLSWDRKWLYIVSHFVEPTCPTSWDWQGRSWGKTRKSLPVAQGQEGQGEGQAAWEKRVFATCMSKYVFKIGRLTVNPSVVIHQSGLLPDGRPGGWTGGAGGIGTGTVTPVDLNGYIESPLPLGREDSEWSWQTIERLRLEGLEFAEHFAAMDRLHGMWDAGEDGALGHFAIG